MTNDELELKPCPFCGNSIIGFSEDKTVFGNKWSFADCPACGCRGPFGLSRFGGVNRWNTRANLEKSDGNS